LRKAPGASTALMARLEQILQPSQRELFFSAVPTLVEGIEDVAFLSTQFHLIGKWDRFHALGCHFIPCNGKSSLSRPLAVARQLTIPSFVVFDGDADAPGKEIESHKHDNGCLLNLCQVDERVQEALPTKTYFGRSVVMWRTNIFKEVQAEVGSEVWDSAETRARERHHLCEDVRRKNSLLIALTLEQLDLIGVRSGLLTQACEGIIGFADGHRTQVDVEILQDAYKINPHNQKPPGRI